MTEPRTCRKCGLEKPLEDFAIYRVGKRRGRKYTCLQCYREQERQRWRRLYGSSERTRYMHAERREARQDALRDWLYAYLMEHPCVDCGERDPVVLEFDHVDPAPKTAAISDLLNWVRPLEVIQGEVTKCEVRCANCHRRRTAEEQRWWIVRWGKP